MPATIKQKIAQDGRQRCVISIPPLDASSSIEGSNFLEERRFGDRMLAAGTRACFRILARNHRNLALRIPGYSERIATAAKRVSKTAAVAARCAARDASVDVGEMTLAREAE